MHVFVIDSLPARFVAALSSTYQTVFRGSVGYEIGARIMKEIVLDIGGNFYHSTKNGNIVVFMTYMAVRSGKYFHWIEVGGMILLQTSQKLQM